MENYYEILQVSSKASKEIIEKAFKTLAKKYHPDANPPEKKEWAEEQFKKINAAYEIISDEEKRKKYDEEIIKNIQNAEQEKIKRLYEQNEALKRELDNLKLNREYTQTINSTPENFYNNLERDINRRVEQSVKKAYRDAYMQRMRDYGYTFYRKKSFKEKMKDKLALVLAVIFIFIIIVILWQLPSFRNYVQENEVYQLFIKMFNI